LCWCYNVFILFLFCVYVHEIIYIHYMHYSTFLAHRPALALNRVSWHLAISRNSKRGAGVGGRACALLDLANKRTSTNDTTSSGNRFYACAMCKCVYMDFYVAPSAMI
jgi:hypothetical protein